MRQKSGTRITTKESLSDSRKKREIKIESMTEKSGNNERNIKIGLLLDVVLD